LAPTDAELVRTCLSGDAEAFSGLVHRYRDAVYGLCYARTGNFELARDLAQETFVSAYRSLRQLRAPQRFPAWLRRIAENTCKTARRRARHTEDSLDPSSLSASGNLAEEATTRVAVQAALESLPEDCRLAVSLFYINGYTCREIGDFLSLPASTVKGRLRDGRARLRRRLLGPVKELFQQKALQPDFGGEVMQLIREINLKEDLGGRPVMLLGAEPGRVLPVWIGDAEASHLSLGLAGTTAPRPLTYDLFLRALTAFGINLERTEVLEVRKDNVFLARLMLARGEQRESLDARPSDAINLAIRAKAPIYLSDSMAKRMVERAKAEETLRERGPGPLGPRLIRAPGQRKVMRLHELEPAPILLNSLFLKAVSAGATQIAIRRPSKAEKDGIAALSVGRKQVHVERLPGLELAELRERLAQMALLKVKVGTAARAQSGVFCLSHAGKIYTCQLRFSPSRLTIKIKTPAPRRPSH
jgi:RNA polymerase sigma factor (sigma-70 family)